MKYETLNYFTAEKRVAQRYDRSMERYEKASVQTYTSLAVLNAGQIDLDHISSELGEVINGSKPGRTDAEQITFFKSVGVAVQDAMAAQIILRNGPALGLGTTIEL